jgi:hypothetical protein
MQTGICSGMRGSRRNMNGQVYGVVNLGDTFTAKQLNDLIASGVALYLTPSDGFIRWIKDAVPTNTDCESVTWTEIGWLANMVSGWLPVDTH